MAVAIVTGCSSGIGLRTAVELARRGDHVYATMRDPARAGPLEEAASSAGVSVVVGQLDVTDDGSVARLVDRVSSEEGRIDALVNNAGRGFMGLVEETSDDELHAIFDTNVFGPLRTIRAVLPVMRATGGGRIVNVSSVNGNCPAAFAGPYSATKHALEALTFAMDVELRHEGIRVVVVAPGGFQTVMAAQMPVVRGAGPLTTAAAEQRRAMTPMTGDPAEAAIAIADVVHAERPSIRTVVGPDWGMTEGRAAMSDDDYFDRAAEMMDAMRGALA